MASPVACFTFDHLRADAPYSGIDAVLDRHGVRATFFLDGQEAARDPAAVADRLARGHEVGCHGWAHEDWQTLDAARERQLLGRATDALRDAGADPRGFRAPGGSRTRSTPEILNDLGYTYDASLGDGMRVSRVGPVTQVPFVWAGVDGAHYLLDPPRPPSEVRARWLETLASVVETGGLFLLICHPEITGTDSDRLAALDTVIGAAVDAGVDTRTVGEVAAA